VAALRDLYSENERLRAENRDLATRLAQLQGTAGDDEALRRALAFDRSFGHRLATAAVVARGGDGFNRTLLIDRGSTDGIKSAMVVLDGSGVVGRVTSVTPKGATVQTIVDPASRVDGYTVSSGVAGVAMGDGSQLEMEVDARPNIELNAGEWVLTSGLDGAFPRGLTLGQVLKLHKPGSAASESVVLGPAADLDQLAAVQVVLDFGG
jgi:rod shape-determining protein MreC